MGAYTFGMWNVQGLTDNKKDTFSLIKRENVDLAVLTETKIRGSGQEEHGRYIHLYSGCQTSRTRAGVSIFCKKNIGHIIRWEAVNESIITAKFNIAGQKVIVIGVYWEEEGFTPNIQYRFQCDLRNELKKVKNDQELIILGDFNSKVGTSTTSKVVGNFGDNEVNNNGRRLIDVCEAFGLKIQDTFFDYKGIHKYIWFLKRNSLRSPINFCITRQDTNLHVREVLECPLLKCGSDHKFYKAIISFPEGHWFLKTIGTLGIGIILIGLMQNSATK